MSVRYNLGKYDAVGHEHITYGGVSLSSLFEILSIDLSALPAIDATTAKIPGRAGLHYYGREFGERTVTMRLSLHVDTSDSLDVFRAWRDAGPALWRETPQRLYLDEEMFLNAVVTGEFPIEFAGERGIVEVQFTCYDPYFHGRTVEIPIKAGETQFMVSSQCEVFPEFDVEKASGSVVITDRTSGCEIVVPGTDRAHVSTEDMRATVDGQFKPLDMLRTDFFTLSPGTMQCVALESGEGVLRYEERAL